MLLQLLLAYDLYSSFGNAIVEGTTTANNGAYRNPATPSTATLTITPAGESAITGTYQFTANQTAEQVVDMLVANLTVAGYTLSEGTPSQLAVTRNTDGQFTAAIAFGQGATITQGAQTTRDFVLPIVDFRSAPTVGGNTLISAIRTNVLNEVGTVHRNRFDYLRDGNSGSFQLNQQVTLGTALNILSWML